MTQPVQYYAKQPRNAAPQGGANPQGAQGMHDGGVVGYGMRGAGQQQQPTPQQGHGVSQAQAYGRQAAPYVQVQLQAGQPQAGQAGQAAQAAQTAQAAQAAQTAQAAQGAQAAQAAQGAQAAHTARAAQVQYAQGGQAGQGYAAHAQRMYAQGAWQAQPQTSGAAAGYRVPATSVPQQLQGSRKRKRGAAFWVIIVLVVLCLAAAGLIAFNMLGHQSSRSGAPGQLEGKSPAEIQAELDRIVDEGMFNISIASVVQMANGSAPAELRIENVPGNPYLMKVAITLDDTGQTVYQTDAIEPNFHIQQDTLDVNLPAGTYDATATFTALDPDTEEEVGQAAAKVMIQVQS